MAYDDLAQRFGKNYSNWLYNKRPRGMTEKQLEEIRGEPIVETHSMYDSPKYVTEDRRWLPDSPSRLHCFATIHSKTDTESIQDKQNQPNCDSKSDIKKLVLHKK